MNEYFKEKEKEYNTDLSNGLNEKQANLNKEKYGENKLTDKKKKSIIIMFFSQFKDVLIIILLIAALISIIIDPHEFIDSLIILIVVIINALLGVIQENKAEKALEALKNLSSPSSKVIRDGSLISIPSSSVVVGDIMLIEAGDTISADGIIIESSSLLIEESSLTGESLPVEKNNEYIDATSLPLSEAKNKVFSSTNVINGKAKILVEAVGNNTEIGKIASMITQEKNTLTPLQHKLDHVGKIIGIISLIICAIVFILELVGGASWINAFKSAIALSVAAIPEGLATVVTIVLALGVSKMSKHNALIKKLPAVETLGSTSVVCSDKTGTLTQNKMSVVKIYKDKLIDVDTIDRNNEEIKEFLYDFAICCDAKIINQNDEIKRIGDPTELALLDINLIYGKDISSSKRIIDIPFDSERKLMTTVIKKDDKYLAITKGAPDELLKRCKISKEEETYLLKLNEEMASNALRVLGLATKEFIKLPCVNDLEIDLDFKGLVGMIDPCRKEVKEAIRVCKKAGIKPVMITGDHLITAKAIAKELGIYKEGDKCITSQELDKLDDEFLKKHIKEYSVFARVAPKDKVRIVEAWQKNGEVVAMTGDGVNDAPALKKADIGCAMGIGGTSVSKESADIILMDDNFNTIIVACKQGRGIYLNILRCVKYLLSSNIGEVFTIFIASILALFLKGKNHLIDIPLLPIHLLWINLITDTLPSISIGMEEISDDVMNQSPKRKDESFFNNHLGLKIALEGIIIGTLTLCSYLIGLLIFKEQLIAQTMAFMTLSTTQLFHAYNSKSDHSLFSPRTFKNKFMNLSFILGISLQILIIYTPYINDIFKLSPLSFVQFIISIGLASLIILFMEISKLITNKK